MKQSFLGLRTCTYKVSDIEKATTWYSSILGIEPYFNEPFYVGFNVAATNWDFNPMQKMRQKLMA